MPKKAKTERKNQVAKAANGQSMTIVEYRNTNDIDVLFEDSTMVMHTSYKQFLKGEIANPKVPVGSYSHHAKIKKNRINETITNKKNGLKMTIIRYENAHNIDVKFENGIIVLGKTYANFKTGQIKMTTMFPNGIRLVKFAYRKMDEWYYICEHDDWKEQRILSIREICPEPIATNQISEKREVYGSLKDTTNTATNGMIMTCIEDNGSKDITIRFEDGAIARHQRREAFLKGYIRHPSKSKHSYIDNKHIGEVYYDKQGRKMTIVEYYSNSNVTIEYDDENKTRLKNKEYRIIKKGADLYPKSHVGETKIARNGLSMTIIDDSVWNDVHIQFEDKTVVKGCTYRQFVLGAIKHPDYASKSLRDAKTRSGLERTMKNGLKAKIIKYESATSIDILFENGIVSLDKDWNSFKLNKIGMPRYIGQIHIKEFAYRIENDWFYIVEKKGWNEDRIMSVKQMYEMENTNYATMKLNQKGR